MAPCAEIVRLFGEIVNERECAGGWSDRALPPPHLHHVQPARAEEQEAKMRTESEPALALAVRLALFVIGI